MLDRAILQRTKIQGGYFINNIKRTGGEVIHNEYLEGLEDEGKTI